MICIRYLIRSYLAGLRLLAARSVLNRLEAGDQAALLAQLAGSVEPLGLRLDPQTEQVLGRFLQVS